MGDRTTIYDIAKRLNITAATVSRALSNNSKISKKTRELVFKTAEEMNYRQNKLALALKSGKSNNVGVIVPRIDRNIFSAVIRGIEENLHSEGYQVIICQSHDDEKLEIENIDALINAQVDGIIMSLTLETSEKNKAIKRIVKKGIPLIFFDRKKDIEGVSTVTINDFEGGYKATQHLIDQGCKEIAHLAGDFAIEIYEDRYKGYREALSDNGIEFREEFLIHTSSKVEDGQKATRALLKLKERPDAIFSASDFVALGAIQELRAQGIKIPQDFCVVGFSNEPFTKFMELSMSTIDQSPRDMGKIAANVFLEQVTNNDNVKIQKKVVLAPELLIRDSSSRLPIK
ncbi:LacI family DNA-binding transcriptional regulator [Portibacter lacus]|uniref:LacI family transcriptional regulator n=1 Tax=Portibacter lacus TaxID=1099794 RepID=A0AA37WD38_9BACT|nr:LacI family DNA-binding transcriptional regulator [Portibacter lacus]GLR15462.1 LacI family transcriptional regulator [Portibacter lacus]